MEKKFFVLDNFSEEILRGGNALNSSLASLRNFD